MFRLSPTIDCRSIIAKNSNYQSKISKIDHRKQIMCEMLRTECTPFELAIIYNMAAPIDLNNYPFNKYTVAVVTREGYLPNFIVNNTKYQQRLCGFMTRIAYMYTSSALPSEEIRNSSTIYSAKWIY